MGSLPKKFDTMAHSYVRMGHLGEGASGNVFEVRRSDGEVCALKLLRPNAISSTKLQRFHNEVAFCMAHRHNGIIKLTDSGFSIVGGQKCPFYVMPKYRATLRTRMQSIVANDALSIYSRLLDAIEAAHLLDVWHRDIKPENVLVDDNDGICVADFGIAHFAEPLLVAPVQTLPQERLANFQYAAPEQRLAGSQVDKRADIYALGLMLNELFTKQVPHGVGFVRVEQVAPQFAYLDEIVDRMIRQQPVERYQNVREVKSALIAAGNQFVVQQNVSKLSNTIVQANAVDDLLVIKPVSIAGVDYLGRDLVFKLEPTPNDVWKEVFQRIDYSRCLMGKSPTYYRFNSEGVARIEAGPRETQQVVDDTKRFIEITNRDYARRRQSEAKERERQERHALQQRREAEETRLKVLRQIKL